MPIKSKRRQRVKVRPRTRRATSGATAPKYSAKLTSKYQATIPKEIRKHLHLKSGDQIVYELLHDNTVVVRKTTPLDLEYLKAISSTLNEWESEEDEQAYKHR